MIDYSQISEASFDVRRKAKHCRARQVENAVYVLPLDPAKERRVVVFLNEGIICVSTDGVQCEANSFRNVCYHAVAAQRRKEINAKRRRTLAQRRAA